mgnify:CR=1 FL=1
MVWKSDARAPTAPLESCGTRARWCVTCGSSEASRCDVHYTYTYCMVGCGNMINNSYLHPKEHGNCAHRDPPLRFQRRLAGTFSAPIHSTTTTADTVTPRRIDHAVRDFNFFVFLQYGRVLRPPLDCSLPMSAKKYRISKTVPLCPQIR